MEKTMKFRALKQNMNVFVLFHLMLFGMTSGNNEVVINKIEVLVNDIVFLHCHTDASIDIQWHFNSLFNYVFAGGRLWHPYRGRLRTEDDKAGSHFLIIPKVSSEDAGWYYCSEEETGRRISSTHLTVLYSAPVCYSNMHPDGFIGPNTCSLEQDNMVFNCVVSFNGTSPHLMWRLLNDNRTLNSSICEDKPNRRNCSLILKSEPIYDGSIFICQTTASIESGFNCSTEVTKILYLFATNDTAKKYVNDNVNCSAKSNLNVKYNWTLQQSNKVSLLSSKQTLLIQKPGIYQCEVNYSLKNYTCITLASIVNVSVESTEAGTISSGSTTLAIILSIVLVFSVLFTGTFMLIRKLRKRKREKRMKNMRIENARIRKKVEGMHTDFISMVDPQNVLKPLIQKHVLSKTEGDDVLKRGTNEDSCRALLDHLSSSSHTTSFIVLKNALNEYYPRISERIDASDDNPRIKPESQLHKMKVTSERHHDFLVDRMFPVINEKLHEDLCITSKEINAIRKKETFREKNQLLMKYLIKNQREEKLLEVLEKSDQKHLVNYLENDGKYIEAFGGYWPVTKKETLIIQSNHEAFVDLIEIGDLIGLLYQTGVINKEQQNIVLSQSEPHMKNEALLEILRRCSLNSYWQIIRCLRDSKQCHIADILETGGVMVRVDSKLNHENHLVTEEISAHIVTLINNINSKMHRVKDERLLDEMLQLKLIGAKQRQDVSLYFLCNQSEEVDRLQKMAKDGRLKKFAESLFNQLNRIQEEIKVTLKWTPNIFTKSRALVQAIRAEVQISQLTPTHVDDIPLELIDVIIKKSFAIFIQMKSQPEYGKHQEGFKLLAEVNDCWFKRTTKRRFKNDLWSYLSGIYEKKNSISIFWRNNRQFIEENAFQLRNKATGLKNQDLLSDIQCVGLRIARKAFIVKKALSSNKSTYVSLILNHKNETNINLFIEYLPSSECRWILKTMRNCGASVRVEINSRSPIEDEKITRFFEDSGSESLESMKDRDFVRWIWCKSSDPKQFQQSKYLRRPFSYLIEESPQRINEIRINVDRDQLKKKAVVRQIKTINEHVKAVGVTKLRNEFYCLNYYGKVKVFRDRNPFVLLRKFQLKEIEKAFDIVSCEKENALYILDIHKIPHRAYVWKIEHISKSNQSQIKWLELPDDFRPSNLFMSINGQLLMVSQKPSPSLRVYGSDAQLHLSVSLHQYIKRPIHAVQTSTGNFVILHLFEEKEESTITTLSRDGKTIVHNYQPENKERRLIGLYYIAFNAGYLSIDSNDRVLVADSPNDRVILLDSNLRWNQILFPNNEGKDEDRGKKSPLHPHQLYYDEGKKQLLVYGSHGVEIVFCSAF